MKALFRSICTTVRDKVFWLSLLFLAVFSYCLTHALEGASHLDQSHDMEERIDQLEYRLYVLESVEKRSFRSHDLFCSNPEK